MFRIRQTVLLIIFNLVITKCYCQTKEPIPKHQRNASVAVDSPKHGNEQTSLKWNSIINSLDVLAEVAKLQCPYTDFCYANTTTKSLFENEESCCKSCSCSEQCGHQLSCCFEDFDKVKIVKNYNMECISPKISYTNMSRVSLRDYYMITDCLDNLDYDCKTSTVGDWGSFFPVYSETADAIFFNRHCAECNHIRDAVNWSVSLSCDVNAQGQATVTTDILQKALDGKACEIIFLPPEGMQKFVCFKHIMNKCNVTGKWKEYDTVIMEGCENVNAPVREYLEDGPVFANIFCVICNGMDYNPLQTCIKYKHHLKSPTYTSFSVLLDVDVVNTAFKHGVMVDKNTKPIHNCGNREIKHPFKDECREILCPNGYLRTLEGCRLYTPTWYVDGYRAFLDLDAIQTDNLLSLKDFDHDQLIENIGSIGLHTDVWFLYAATVQGTDKSKFVRGFSIVTGSTDFPLDAKATLETVQLALKQAVLLRKDNSSYVYKIELADHERVQFKEDYAGEDNGYFYIGSKNYFRSNFIISKLYFCNQVKLGPNEWLYVNHSESIELTLGGNDRKILNELEYSKYMTESGTNYIQICLEDFKPTPAYTNNNNAIMLYLNIVLPSTLTLIKLLFDYK